MIEKPRDVPMREIWDRIKVLSAQQCAQILLLLAVANSGSRAQLLAQIEKVLRGQAEVK